MSTKAVSRLDLFDTIEVDGIDWTVVAIDPTFRHYIITGESRTHGRRQFFRMKDERVTIERNPS